jgi:predicted ABC-type ATPase
MSPSVYIIAGPNGAGKTTFARQFLPNFADCKNFVNADLIAQGISPFSPEAAALRAGRLMLDEIADLAKQRADFGFETTLSGHSHLKLLRDLKNIGYQLNIFYLWLPRVELALDRVRTRVQRGGHNIPDAIVRRRFDRSIRNFLNHYCLLAESWIMFDNSGDTPKTVVSFAANRLSIIMADEYEELVARYGGK